MKTRTWITVGAGALIAATIMIWAMAGPDRLSETNSIETPAYDSEAAVSMVVTPTHASPALPRPASASEPVDPTAAAAGAAAYPVNLDELRARLPGNRYWELGAPTSDPAIARARAERAKRDNAVFGRTQTGEAPEPEIRAYYAEQRRISEDYLQLWQLVLAEQAGQLPDRDRTLFALGAKLNRERLTQIERDLADALARRRERHS